VRINLGRKSSLQGPDQVVGRVIHDVMAAKLLDVVLIRPTHDDDDLGAASRDGLGQVDGGLDARLVTQCIGQIATARDPELLVDALQVGLDRSHRNVTVGGDLFVGAAGGGLQGGVELAGSEAGLGRDALDDRGDSSFAAGEELPCPVLVGRRFAGTSVTSQGGGGFDACFCCVEEGAQSFEGSGDLTERRVVLGHYRVGVSSAGSYEFAVDLGGEVL